MKSQCNTEGAANSTDRTEDAITNELLIDECAFGEHRAHVAVHNLRLGTFAAAAVTCLQGLGGTHKPQKHQHEILIT